MDWNRGAPRRRRRRRGRDRRHRRGRRHADRGRAELRPHRPERVGPDRPDRLQDEPDQGRRRATRVRTSTTSSSTPNAHELAAAALRAVHRPGPRRALRRRRWPRTTTSASCSPRARSRCRPARPSASAWRWPTAATSTSCAAPCSTVQQIYNANYQFAVPPPLPTLTAEAGDGYVRLSWDDVAERGVDPVTRRVRLRGLPDLSLDRPRLPRSRR